MRKIIIFVILAVVIILFSLTLLPNMLPSPIAPTLLQTSTPTPDTSSWKEYKSPRYNYKFKYPSTWTFSPFDEENKAVLYGSHSLFNYDMVGIEKYMDHGMVDWKKFMGEKTAVKVDLFYQTLEGSQNEFLAKQFTEALEVDASSFKLGNLPTRQFDSSNTLSGDTVTSFAAFPKADEVIVATVFVYNEEGKDLEEDIEYLTLKQIFSTFSF